MIIDVPKYLLIFFRVLSILWLLPIFSMRSVSVLFKVAFAIVTSLLITEVVPYAETLANDPYGMLLAVLREVLIGLSIGFAIRLLFMCVQAAGEIVSFQTGFAFARVVDPFSSGQASVLEQFLYMLGIMMRTISWSGASMPASKSSLSGPQHLAAASLIIL
ncbi:MAG: flagellar biosynthesispathway, component FliR [Deltaproteobacteria bacterium]|nr:flagellar biosynthesispathway, component FliR [Deltaproteobacteria bacterium]